MNEDRPQVSFVVPCYNEKPNIAATAREIAAAARDAGLASYEIVIVDDCSPDGTGDFAAELARGNPNIKLVRNARNLGFGGAYKAGVREARGSYVIMVPGDNAHPRESIVPILKKRGQADIVVPYVENMAVRAPARRIISRAFTLLVNAMFGMSLPYTNGTVLYRTDLLHGITLKTDGFAYQAETLAKLIRRRKASYVTVGVNITERTAGKSSALKPKNVYRVAKALAAMWWAVHFGADESL